MQFQNLFFNRPLSHEAINGDGFLLSDAVGAVGGLVFDRRVPPRVEVDDVVGSGQVEARAARLEENRATENCSQLSQRG